MLWQSTCGKTGACLFYDTNRFRYKIFGFSLLFQVFSSLAAFGLLWAVRGRVRREAAQEEQKSYLIVGPGAAEEEAVLLEKISGV